MQPLQNYQDQCQFKAFADIKSRRGNRYRIDLSGKTLTQVLRACAVHHYKSPNKYNKQVAIIEQIEEVVGGEPFMLEDVCDEFWREFQIYFLTTPNEKGIMRKPSSGGTYSQEIMAALSWAAQNGAVIDPSYRKCKWEKYKKKKIIPTETELSNLYSIDFDNDKLRKRIRERARELDIHGFSFAAMKRVIDAFVLDCSLGQRISDLKRIDKSSFSDDKAIVRVSQQKTGSTAIINLTKFSIDKRTIRDILNKYDYTSPCLGMNTNLYNNLLHLAFWSLGGYWLETEYWENKINGVIVRESAPRYSLVTSHTARRKFVSKEIKKKEQTLTEIQRATGHQDLRQISTYDVPEEQ